VCLLHARISVVYACSPLNSVVPSVAARVAVCVLQCALHIHIFQRRDRGIYSISWVRSLCSLHFIFSQFMGPEAYSWIFVPVLLG